MLSPQGFHWFIRPICLLRDCSFLGFDCLFLCLLRHYTVSSSFQLFHYLFVTSLLCSMLRLFLPLFLRRYTISPKRNRQMRVMDLPKVPTLQPKRDSNPQPFRRKVSNQTMSQHAITILSLQCFIVSLSVLLRHFSVLGFDCLFLCLLRHYTISSDFDVSIVSLCVY